jgi:MoxR-like ATPase
VTTPQLEHAIRIKARTYATRLAEVKSRFVGREDAVDIVAMATLCREHVLLIGPPGTAKSSLLDRLRQLLDARYFTYLLTRFTEPAELFGPLDLRLFQTEGTYRVNTVRMLPEAHIVFLDEIFQGSSAILNSLLTIVNERRFHNGSELVDASLVSLFGSSNEIPDDPLLAAFSDRFLLRCQLGYVPDDLIEDVLDKGWAAEREQARANTEQAGDTAVPADRLDVGFPLADLVALQRALLDIDLSPIRDPFAQILRAFRAEGVAFSDRRAVKAQKTFAASALLAGRARAEAADLAPLVHLWTDPHDEASIRRIVTDHEVPVDDQARVVRDVAEVSLDLRQVSRLQGAISSPEQCREVMRRLHKLALELRRDHPDARELLGAVQQAQREALTLYRERFEVEGYVNV